MCPDQLCRKPVRLIAGDWRAHHWLRGLRERMSLFQLDMGSVDWYHIIRKRTIPGP
ncbi:hypothetical protein GMJAKD_09060 [Candidatus Electrothrix aarhusensis]|jgi:hypothetical protein